MRMSDPQWWLLDDLVLARSTVDRAAEHRTDQNWIAEARHRAEAQFVHIHHGNALMDDDGLVLAIRPEPDVPVTLLGIDEHGTPYFSAHHNEAIESGIPNSRWSDLRMSGSSLSATEAGLMVAAVALDNWSRSHRFCPRCGGTLEWNEAGWSRRCSLDGTSHFPRTDPAVIVLVRDSDDRALLGRQVRWEPTWFSTLAGFVEAGESAEAALRREVFEESGVRVDDDPSALTYLGSQPWPFPGSLMLGYHAWAADSTIAVDGTEIAEARWFTRADMRAACESGEISLPPAVSIARKLIERWYGEPLPGDWSRPMTKPSR